MSILKSKPVKDQEQPDSTRRSFMWKLGAGISAVVATAVPGIARAGFKDETGLKTRIAGLSGEIARLEGEKAIRHLQQEYESLLDKGKFEELPELFADDGEVIFNGGIFKGKNRGISRLFCHQFKAGLTGKRIGPAPGFEIDQEHDVIDISSDGKSASARFFYSMQVGTSVNSDSVLVKMARLQGEGIMKWWEGGIYEASCAKDVRRDTWKIKRLEYRAFSRSDYRPGKAYAVPISVPKFFRVFPEDPAGPDKLVEQG